MSRRKLVVILGTSHYGGEAPSCHRDAKELRDPRSARSRLIANLSTGWPARYDGDFLPTRNASRRDSDRNSRRCPGLRGWVRADTKVPVRVSSFHEMLRGARAGLRDPAGRSFLDAIRQRALRRKPADPGIDGSDLAHVGKKIRCGFGAIDRCQTRRA